MKMGNTRSPSRYDIAACVAPQSPKLRRPAIPRYAAMQARNILDHHASGRRIQSPSMGLGVSRRNSVAHTRLSLRTSHRLADLQANLLEEHNCTSALAPSQGD
jgi:hypothetical protein